MAILSLGDALTLPVASATDNVDGVLTDSIIYDDSSIALYYDAISESYIITEPGIYYIYFSVTDSSNNETLFVIKISVTETGEVVYEGYYASIDGLSGNDLINELYNLLSSTDKKTNTYGDARYILEESDVWVNYNTNYSYLIYTDTLKGSVSQGYPDEGPANAIWDGGVSWNREHVWAKSLLGNGYDATNSTKGIAADMHNLRAADTNVNSTRNNNKFTSEVYISGGFGNYGGEWYPGDNHRGDVARILFYMDIRWGSETDLSKIGYLNTLITWHEVDPVDEFEINRNNVIYNSQGNRNPFIDHPELVNEVFVN